MSETHIMPLHQRPPQRPAPQSPSCFSQLYALNQCYDDILMMQNILQKVICDMAANNAEFQQCLVDGITKSGSNVPLIGVTNGSDAQPGQVGEWMALVVNGTYPTGNTSQPVSIGILQPGDWDIFGALYISGATDATWTSLSPLPPGFSVEALSGGVAQNGGGGEAFAISLSTTRALISVPTLMVMTLNTNAGSNTGADFQYIISARRAR